MKIGLLLHCKDSEGSMLVTAHVSTVYSV